MAADPNESQHLDQSLERLEDALARGRESGALAAPASSAALAPARSTVSLVRPLGIALMAVLLVALLYMGATAGPLYSLPALIPGLVLVALLVRRSATPAIALLTGSGDARVGMGASVASVVVLGEGSAIDNIAQALEAANE